MQIHRQNVALMIIPITISIVLWLLKYQVTTLPDWVFITGYSICGLLFCGSLIALIPSYRKQNDSQNNDISKNIIENKIGYANITKIKHQEPSNRPPLIFDVYLIAYSVLMLCFTGLVIYLTIFGEITFSFSLSWLLFFLLFTVLPLYILYDYIFVERKYRKSGKSRVLKENTLIVAGDIPEIFCICLEVLDEMDIKPITMERPKYFKGLFRSIFYGNSIVTLKNTQLKDHSVKIIVSSDAQWITVKLDIFNSNQRIINRFEHLIRSRIQQLKTT